MATATRVVRGKFLAGFAVCRFVMRDAKSATIWLGETPNGIVWNRVKYTGHFHVIKSDVDGLWKELGGHNVIRREDKKEIDYKGSYFKMVNTIMGSWIKYITHEGNSGVLIIAACVNVENERSKYVADIQNAQHKLFAAERALQDFDGKRGELLDALRLGVSKLSAKDYDATNVVIGDN